MGLLDDDDGETLPGVVDVVAVRVVNGGVVDVDCGDDDDLGEPDAVCALVCNTSLFPNH